MSRQTPLSLALAFALATPTAAHAAHRPHSPRRAGSVLYKIREGATLSERRALAQIVEEYGLRTLRKILNGKTRVDLASNLQAITEEELSQELQRTGAVEFAEPDYLVEPAMIPNDPVYSSQWQHSAIRTPAAWDLTTGSSAVKAAICDSGVESNHPDLKDNLILPGFNTVDNSTNSEPVMPHGTRVAGYFGARGGNGIGVAGVAWNVKILPIRITNQTSGSAFISDMAECVRYAADRGSKVVNLSYTGADSSSIDSAAQYLRSKGGLLFMAAGNDGTDLSGTHPDYRSFILVGATTSTTSRASFSNYGTAIDIVAPGQSVYTTNVGGGYVGGSGTSFAAPIAAGVGALLYSLNPAFTPDEVQDLILSTARDIGATGDDAVYGRGLIDAGAAVAKAAAIVGATPDPDRSTVRINAGGQAGATTLGAFTADTSYIGGTIYNYTGVDVAGTSDDALYSTVRYGASFRYSFPVVPGSYRVRLHFMEGSFTTSGQRRIHVSANGASVVSGLDVFAAAGGANRALVRSFAINVTGANLDLSFTSGYSNRNTMVSAIEVLPD